MFYFLCFSAWMSGLLSRSSWAISAIIPLILLVTSVYFLIVARNICVFILSKRGDNRSSKNIRISSWVALSIAILISVEANLQPRAHESSGNRTVCYGWPLDAQCITDTSTPDRSYLAIITNIFFAASITYATLIGSNRAISALSTPIVGKSTGLNARR